MDLCCLRDLLHVVSLLHVNTSETCCKWFLSQRPAACGLPAACQHLRDLLQVVPCFTCPTWLRLLLLPGESQAEWFMDGLLERLTNPHDAVGRALQRDAVLYMVPNCNPDGTWRGHLRTNSAGANLNREWANPCLDTSPEVFHLQRVMDETGG